MKFGVYIPNFKDFGTPESIVELGVLAEEAGWDGIFLMLDEGLSILGGLWSGEEYTCLGRRDLAEQSTFSTRGTVGRRVRGALGRSEV
ncbi:LLM class flavin-dependent oxidoreductase [Streptomyces sp. MN03-5084-2B]|nr:LLM class flavin-dependent oxidoreductase [Streptomyces sp. MN03-5084-2B]